MDHRIDMTFDGQVLPTLADVLPERGPLRMLIIGRAPSPASVEAGHYFVDRMGRGLWKRLDETGLLHAPPGRHPDEVTLELGYGLTDLCKLPREFGEEPAELEYQEGWERVSCLVAALRPGILTFVYKAALDTVLKCSFGWDHESVYGFNDDLMRTFGRRVFAFPMPGAACTLRESRRHMDDLSRALNVQ
jgi:hypothetical protein